MSRQDRNVFTLISWLDTEKEKATDDSVARPILPGCRVARNIC